MNKLGSLIFIVAFLVSCITKDDKSESTFKMSPTEVALILSNELLSRPNFMRYNTRDVYAIHYAEICAAYGAVKFANLVNNQKLMKALIEHYKHATPEYIPNSNNHVDANVYGVLPLEIYLYTQEQTYLKEGLFYADEQWSDTLPNGLSSQTRFWIDDMYMIGCLQTQAYRASGNPEYLQRAALTLDAYIKELQQPNGLFHHGNQAPFYWGRGNGWVAAGFAELLSELPVNTPYYPSILNAYKTMMATLIENQGEDGMWNQLIDHSESFKETSSTAMFAYAMAIGVKKNLLPKTPYTQAYIKAWNALVEYLDDNGKIHEVCVGTGQSMDIEYYFERPRVTGDLHGQAPMLWLANTLLSNQK